MSFWWYPIKYPIWWSISICSAPGICSPCAIPPLRARRTLLLAIAVVLSSAAVGTVRGMWTVSPAVPEFMWSCFKDGCVQFQIPAMARGSKQKIVLCDVWFLDGEEHSYSNSVFFSEKARRQLGRSFPELVWFHRLILQGISYTIVTVCL